MALWLLGAFLVMPILEIWVILQVGSVIGTWPTVALLVAESLFGAWIVRREGRRAWVELRAALGSGRLPSRELADGALLLVGGTLLLTPGFVTDAAGFLLVLPPSRAIVRRFLLARLARRAARAVNPFAAPRPRGRGAHVIRGEAVDRDRGPAGPG